MGSTRRRLRQVGRSAGTDANPVFHQAKRIRVKPGERRERPVDADEMVAIAGIDRGDRLIKGHVFLWKADQSWEDLWDINGVICRRARRLSQRSIVL